MKAATRAWLAKAEGDWSIAESQMRRRTRAVHDGVCFHAQQCVEKYMKAYLQEQDVRFKPTHNLLVLLDQIRLTMPDLELLRPDLLELTNYAVAFRYPGPTADRRLANRALTQCRRIREMLRVRLGMRPQSRRRDATGRTSSIRHRTRRR